MVPHLKTAASEPILALEARMLESMPAIERWFRLEWMEHTPPLMAEVDLRNAGYKLAPIDTVLHPQGFGFLDESVLPQAVQAAMAAIEKICPEARNLLIIPARRDSSPHARANLERLVQIFGHAGLNVRLGALSPEMVTPPGSVGPLTLEPLVRLGPHRLGIEHFDPCTILVNDALQGGIPEVLTQLTEQYVMPPLHASWPMRRKSLHFEAYSGVARRFAKLLGMDPWLIDPIFSTCAEGGPDDPEGLDRVRAKADEVLQGIRRKHRDYGIADRPFVVIKADNGSPAQPVVRLFDAADLTAEQLRPRTQDARGQPLPPVQGLLIQEGVPTHERLGDAAAEPVVLTIDRYVVGGYYRSRRDAGADADLDRPDAERTPLPFAESQALPRLGEAPGSSAPNRFYMYGVVARLATVAAAYELEATDPRAESDE